MHRPRRVQHCHWFLWRYGRLRDDWSVYDQREIRRSYPCCWDRGSCVLVAVHLGRFQRDRVDPIGGPCWRDVHGCDRHLCLELIDHFAQGSKNGCLCDLVGDCCDRDGGSCCSCCGWCDRKRIGLCMEQRPPHQLYNARVSYREGCQSVRDQRTVVLWVIRWFH